MEKHCQYCGKDLPFKRVTRKYCDGNCKQLAYYKRKGNTLSGTMVPESTTEEVTVKEPVTVKPDDLTVNSEQQAESTSKASVSPADTAKENLSVKPEEKNTVVKKEPEESYEWEESRFLERIQHFINKGYNEQYMFQHPNQYWAGDTLGIVCWITQCLLCLTESIVQLSNRRYIDNHTLCEIADAFNRIVDSYSFKFLPANYPYKDLIKDLQYKMNALSNANRDNEKVRFRLSPERKAKLIATRFIIGNFVPKVKFSELEIPLKPDFKL